MLICTNLEIFCVVLILPGLVHFRLQLKSLMSDQLVDEGEKAGLKRCAESRMR